MQKNNATPGSPRRRKRKMQSSKRFCLLGCLAGLILGQECLGVMIYAIRMGFDGTASWLTAAVTMAQAIIIACISGYFSLCKIDHSEKGITFETAKANGFVNTYADDTASY